MVELPTGCYRIPNKLADWLMY